MTAAAGNANKAAREAQVQRAVHRLANGLEAVEKSLVHLESRVSPALRPTTPQPPDARVEGKQIHEVKAPLAEILEQACTRLGMIENTVHSLAQRSEL